MLVLEMFLVQDWIEREPIFFAGYTEENPRITTACGHNFHLSCIYEWMERSKRCPLCDKVLTLMHYPYLLQSLDSAPIATVKMEMMLLVHCTWCSFFVHEVAEDCVLLRLVTVGFASAYCSGGVFVIWLLQEMIFNESL
jgi:hypothetical protein